MAHRMPGTSYNHITFCSNIILNSKNEALLVTQFHDYHYDFGVISEG